LKVIRIRTAHMDRHQIPIGFNLLEVGRLHSPSARVSTEITQPRNLWWNMKLLTMFV